MTEIGKTIMISTDLHKESTIKGIQEGDTVGKYAEKCLQRIFDLGINDRSWNDLLSIAEKEGLRIGQVISFLIKSYG
jgi:hypothetical protein